MPEVSIIVPVYNVEKYLEKCIESIIYQSFEDWELILVDDGSPDNSGAICDRMAAADKRIRVIHKNNEGVSKARNVGIENAQGEYLCFIDSDDWVEPTYLGSMMNHIEGKNSVVYGNVINDYTYGKESSAVFDYTDEKKVNLDTDGAEIAALRLLENGFPFAKLFRKDVIDETGLRFDENLSYHEDHLFVLNYLKHIDTISLSSFPGYHYVHRIGNNSLSKRKHSSANMIDASTKLLETVRQGNKRWNIQDKAYVNRMYTYLGLNQLMVALSQADTNDLPSIASAIRDKFAIFSRHYSPNRRILKLVPLLIKWRFDSVYLTLLKWKERHS